MQCYKISSTTTSRSVVSPCLNMSRANRSLLKMSGLQVGQWTSTCLETCIKRLADLNKPFKYVVTTVIMQKNGKALVQPPSGVHACSLRLELLLCRCWPSHGSFMLLGQRI